MNSDKFCILLTAQNCGHCQHYRGDGILNSNQAYMHPEFLKKVIAPYKDIRMKMLNIHYYDMNNSVNSGIMEISTTYMLKNNIVQERFFTSKDRKQTFVELRTFNTKTNKTKLNISKREIMKDNKPVEWLALLKDKISPKLSNYTYAFPGFLLTDKNNWRNTFNGKSELVAYLNMGWTIETENGEVMLEKNGATLSERGENIMQMIDKYVVHNTEIKPHKSFLKNDDKADKEDKKNNLNKNTKDSKSKEVRFSDQVVQVVQVSYDD